MAVTEHAVLIAGGGPTGMMLAAELRLAGVDVGIVERRTTLDQPGTRARGLHARTIEVLDQRGIADRFLAQGTPMQVSAFAGVPLDLSGFPTRHGYGLALLQGPTERLLAEWIAELDVPVHRGAELTGFTDHGTGVEVAFADGTRVTTQYLVGCDGGRSLVRRTAGIEFAGWDATHSSLIAEVSMREEPELGVRHDAKGVHAIGPMDDGQFGVVLRDEDVVTSEPTLDDLRRGLIALYGTDYGVHSPTWLSRFTDTTRQAAEYRRGRVLVAGDAAHVHSPVGGQGLNLGLQDAVNLGWKLAQVVHGTAPDRLLDTYHAERHAVAARVLKTTMAQTALARLDDRVAALRDKVAELLDAEAARTRIAAELSGLDIAYDLGDGHPLRGRRMPDLDLLTADGPTRVYELLHRARPVLLDLDERPQLQPGPWSDRVDHVRASAAGAWELPVLGAVDPPTSVLIRPDGHVAWVGEGTAAGLEGALATWFGSPADEFRTAEAS